MTHEPITFTITDPRTFDGNPYEVAGRAVRQAAAVNQLLFSMLPALEAMLRNAEMERAFDSGQLPDASEWPAAAQARVMVSVAAAVAEGARLLAILEKAAEFNPRAPLPKEAT